MEVHAVAANPGSYLIIGRKEDLDVEVYTVIDKLPQDADLRQLCSVALKEIGARDPNTYDFSTMIHLLPKDGCRVVLTRSILHRFVHVNYA